MFRPQRYAAPTRQAAPITTPSRERLELTTVAHPTPSRARHATTLITVNPPPQKLAVALACLPVAAAFVAPAPAGASVKVQETKADLEALAVKLNPVVGFYDPLGAVHKSNVAAFRRSTDYELSIYLI